MTTHTRPVVAAYARAANAMLLLALVTGCGRTTPAGYWEGKGTAKEIPIRADPGVSAGFSGVTVKGNSEAQIIKIAMKPFSPFNGSATVAKRPDGPFAASFDKTGSNYSINWSARQMGGEQRKVELTPEMQQAVQKLRQQLKN
jgi:hypothetical protein